jgi:type II secretion system protein H
LNAAAAGLPARAARGFTLIELMAVVAILALFTALALPNLGQLSNRYLTQQAARVQGALEFARESAVVSAKPHHFVVDIDTSTYQIYGEEPPAEDESSAEGEAPEGDPAAELTDAAAEALDAEGSGKISLAPPKAAEAELVPVSGPLGAQTHLLDEIFFAGVQSEEGWTESGRVEIEFAADGVARRTIIVLENTSGERAGLEVLPLLETVRILDREELAER